MKKFSFNILHQPWIPLLRLNGKVEEVSLLHALEKAHLYKELHSQYPPFIPSIVRFIIAFITRAYGTIDDRVWTEIWEKKRFDMHVINRYVKRWENRFDLFDDTYPFYQVRDLELHQDPTPAKKLYLDRASGNNAVFFDHSWDEKPSPVSYSECARLLLTTQASPIGGGRSGSVKKPKVDSIYSKDGPISKQIITLLVGNNFFETLAFNLIDHKPVKSDIPQWEEDKYPPKSHKSLLPAGYLHWMTWQSRFLRLLPESDHDGGMVNAFYSVQGHGVPDIEGDTHYQDPFSTVIVQKKGRRYWKARADRLLWRDLHVLLAETSDNAPLNIRTMSKPARRKRVGDEYPIRIYTYGMIADQANVDAWISDTISLHSILLTDRELHNQISWAITLAEQNAARLSSHTYAFAKEFLAGLGAVTRKSIDKDAARKLKDSISSESSYWSMLDAPFKRFIAHLDHNNAKSESEAWQRECTSAFHTAWDLVVQNIPDNPRSMKALAHAERIPLEKIDKQEEQ